jgi:hypothetical protein
MDHPESLATVVFTRTEKGAEASKSNNKDLPRELKSLLLVVDGQSAVSKFVPYLSRLLPLSEKFTELENAGYIQRSPRASKSLNGQVRASLLLSNLDADHADESEVKQAILANVIHEIEKFLANNPKLQTASVMSVILKITTFDHLHAELPAYFELLPKEDITAISHELKLHVLMMKL